MTDLSTNTTTATTFLLSPTGRWQITDRFGRLFGRGIRTGLLLLLSLTIAACSGVSDALSDVTGSNRPAEGAEQSVEAATTTTTEPQLIAVSASSTDQAAAVEQQIQSIVAEMTVEQKIGQLLMPVLFGTSGEADSGATARQNARFAGVENAVDIVRQYHLGGVLYQEENVQSAEQLRLFSKELRDAEASNGNLGLLIAVDQEGGKVSRVTDQVSEYPAPGVLSGDVEAVREAAYVTGQQVQQQGINVVLAPVADVLIPGGTGFLDQRSYGDDPQTVANMVSASITGLQRAGVAAAAKHWPGHGGTVDDSHEGLPSISVTREEWNQRDRVPFDAAIDQGVEIIMVGHLVMPNLDTSGEPATVSPVLIQDLLRGELGFDGVVMTDALNMGGVNAFESGELAVSAIKAGADMLLQPADLVASADALQAAVASGDLPTERLDESVTRVLRLKQRLGVLPAP